MRNVSLGSLTVLCVLRVLVYNLAKLSDMFLLDNCLAILSNLAPHVEGLHPYACQRLVAVALTALKKCALFAERYHAEIDRQAQATITGTTHGPQAHSAVGVDRATQLDQMLTVYMQCLRTVMGVINTCLRRKQIHKNAALIYALLHKQHELEAASSKASVQGMVDLGMVPDLIRHMNERLERVTGDLSVEKTTEVIERSIAAFVNRVERERASAAGTFHPGAANDGADDEPGKISYEEQADADAFFVPYTWEVIHAHTGDLHWRSDRIAVFATPVATAAASSSPSDAGPSTSPVVAPAGGSGSGGGGGEADRGEQAGFFVGTTAVPQPDLAPSTSDLAV